jgi:hypothetical protein
VSNARCLGWLQYPCVLRELFVSGIIGIIIVIIVIIIILSSGSKGILCDAVSQGST